MNAVGESSAGKLKAVSGLVAPVSLAQDQTLPVLGALEQVLPGGLQRGLTVTVQGGPGANALSLALMAGASKAGSWVAAAGMPSLGIASAAEMGLVLERLVLVATPPPGRWPTVVASLIDSFDLVLVNWPGVSAGMARRLGVRTRDRKAVLISLASPGRGEPWLEVADIRLTVCGSRWEGLGSGNGRLRARRLEVETAGRRSPQVRRTTFWLPDRAGRVAEEVHSAPASPERVFRIS